MHESNFLSAFYFYGCRMEEIDVRVDKAKVERRQRANDDDEFFHKSSFRVFLYHWSSRKVISSKDFLQRFFFFSFFFTNDIARLRLSLVEPDTVIYQIFEKKKKKKRNFHLESLLKRRKYRPPVEKMLFQNVPHISAFLKLNYNRSLFYHARNVRISFVR